MEENLTGKKKKETHMRQYLITSWEVIMIDKLNCFLIGVLQEAAPKVHLCIDQLEGRYNAPVQRSPLNNSK
jgi:hypothetical protein